jgi:hypothetical protein
MVADNKFFQSIIKTRVMKVDLQETLKVRRVTFLHVLISALQAVTSFSLRPLHPSRNISLILIMQQPFLALEVSGGGKK